MNFLVVSVKQIAVLAIIILLAAALCIGAGSVGVFKVGNREIPIYSVERSDNKIALTFDCAWNDDDIASICETLKKHNAHATFFAVGTWAEKYGDSVKLLYDSGHEIANHSYNHAHYSRLSADKMLSDIEKCDDVLTAICGKCSPLFRAPYGEYNDDVIKTCDSSGRTYIQWSVDSIDYGDADRESIIRRSTEKTKSGDIILLHNGTKNTAAALDEILSKLSNFEFVTVSELIYKDNYIIDHAGVQKSK